MFQKVILSLFNISIYFTPSAKFQNNVICAFIINLFLCKSNNQKMLKVIF